MSQQTTFKRRGIIAAAAGAIAGVFVQGGGSPVSAFSGGGDQDYLKLGSNNYRIAASTSPNRAATASVSTSIEATPNFGFYTTANTDYVFGVDARPAATSVDGIVAFAGGDGTAVIATAQGTGTGLEAAGGTIGVRGTGTLAGAIFSGDGFAGLYGVSSASYGGIFAGALAPLALAASTTSGPPTTPVPHGSGALYVDLDGKLFYCTQGGAPGTWIELSARPPVFHTLPTPERFVDTRSGLGAVQGPVAAGTTNTFQMTGRNGQAANPALQVPDNATALIGNLTVLGGAAIPVGSYVTLWPGGPIPTVSNINVGPGGVVANSYTVGLGAASGHGNVSVFNHQICDYILDVTAYYV